MKNKLMEKIQNKEVRVGVVGLGYVGLPLAVEKAKAGFKTIDGTARVMTSSS